MRLGIILILLASFFSLVHARHQNYTSAPPFNNQITNTIMDITDFHGAYTLNGSIFINTVTPGKTMEKKITGGYDMELSWSPDGKWILFSRLSKKTSDGSSSYICIIHPDGTGLQELTGDKFNDFSPTWSREGSNFIIFNRFDYSKWRWYIYRTAVGAKPGDEILISDSSRNETGFTCLRDGRIIIFSDRNAENIFAYLFSSSPEKDGYYLPPYMFVLTPDPGKNGKYEQLRFRGKLEGFPFHLTLSKDENRLSYELEYSYWHKPFYEMPFNTWSKGEEFIIYYGKKSIATAEIDIANLAVSNEKLLYTSKSSSDVPIYPSMTGDSMGLIYSVQTYEKNTEFYYYDFKTQKSEPVSAPSGGDYSYYCDVSLPK